MFHLLEVKDDTERLYGPGTWDECLAAVPQGGEWDDDAYNISDTHYFIVLQEEPLKPWTS